MALYKVEKRGRDWYVVGLKEEFGDNPDTYLPYHYPYPRSETPEVGSPNDAHMMLGSLYDLYQCHDGLKKGDIFQTPFGEYACEGVHVCPLFELLPFTAE